MTISTAIQQAKTKLIKQAQNTGLYENFGQKEVARLTDKYIDTSSYTDQMNYNRKATQEFNEWCMSYNV